MDNYREIANWVGWPAIVTILLLAMSFGGFLLNNRIQTLKEENDILNNRLIRSGVTEDVSAGIKIISPAENDTVDEPINISGTYKDIPEGYKIRVFIFPERGGGYWAQSEVEYDAEKKTWNSLATIGGEPGHSAKIIATIVGNDGQKILDYYKKVADETGQWIGIEELLTDIIPEDEILVYRK